MTSISSLAWWLFFWTKKKTSAIYIHTQHSAALHTCEGTKQKETDRQRHWKEWVSKKSWKAILLVLPIHCILPETSSTFSYPKKLLLMITFFRWNKSFRIHEKFNALPRCNLLIKFYSKKVNLKKKLILAQNVERGCCVHN